VDQGLRTMVGLRVGAAMSVVLVLLLDPPWVYGHLPSRARISEGRELISWLPTSGELVALGAVALFVSCIAVAVGWRVRATATAALIGSIWVLGVPQLFTAANHYHHVVWLMALVALSGGGTDRREDDEWWIRVTVVILGCLYFVPGVAKALTPGWVFSDNLHNTLAAHRLQLDATLGFLPPRWAAPYLAAGAVVFEIGFLFVALTRFRRWAASVAISFHLVVGITAGIWFWTLYPVLVPLLFERPRPLRPDGEPLRTRRAAACSLVAMVWISGGSLRMDAWPFAAYPLFNYRQGSEVLVTEVELDGRVRPVGEVLLPDAPVSRQRKIERHGTEVLEDLVLAVEGRATEVRRRTVAIVE
jgi:hypothetical protein